jgi:hypothetical protein
MYYYGHQTLDAVRRAAGGLLEQPITMELYLGPSGG